MTNLKPDLAVYVSVSMGIRTALPISAERYAARQISTAAQPSSPETARCGVFHDAAHEVPDFVGKRFLTRIVDLRVIVDGLPFGRAFAGDTDLIVGVDVHQSFLADQLGAAGEARPAGRG